MATASVVEIARPAVQREPLWRFLRGNLKGAEYTWALAFVVPYIAVFLTFVAYPVVYGLWMGSEPHLYAELFSDPIFQKTVVNTALYLAFYIRWVGRHPWPLVLAVSIGLPLGSYFLFDKWFMIPMPKGLWGEHLGL